MSKLEAQIAIAEGTNPQGGVEGRERILGFDDPSRAPPNNAGAAVEPKSSDPSFLPGVGPALPRPQSGPFPEGQDAAFWLRFSPRRLSPLPSIT